MLLLLGITDDHTDCQLCGKTGLKRTVALRDLDGGDVLYYGTDCAARATATKGGADKIEARAAHAADRASFLAGTKLTIHELDGAWLRTRADLRRLRGQHQPGSPRTAIDDCAGRLAATEAAIRIRLTRGEMYALEVGPRPWNS